jgi:transcriptional regulator with XRE-family HTH domain
MAVSGTDRSASRFGGYLRRLREQRKLTLEAAEHLSAAFHTRVTSSYLSRLESGRTVPNLARLSSISRIYDVPLTTLVEQYEVEQRRRRGDGRDLPRPFDALEALLRRKLRSGAYVDALDIAERAGERLESDDALAEEYTPHGARYLELVECQAMVHLELYESAKFKAERILEQPGLRTQHQLAAWQFYVACCTKLERFQLALAALDRADPHSAAADAPPRARADLSVLRGNLHVLRQEYAPAVEAYAAALKQYRTLRNRLEVCRCRVHLGGALARLGKLHTAGNSLTKAVEEAEKQGFEQVRAHGLCNLALWAATRDDHRASEAYAFRAGEIAKKLGLPTVEFESTVYLMEAAEALDDRRTADAYLKLLAQQLRSPLPPSPERERIRARLEASLREDLP